MEYIHIYIRICLFLLLKNFSQKFEMKSHIANVCAVIFHAAEECDFEDTSSSSHPGISKYIAGQVTTAEGVPLQDASQTIWVTAFSIVLGLNV